MAYRLLSVHRMRRIVLGVVIVLAAATPARADDTAAADALFNDGKALLAEGRAAEACPKFQASFHRSRLSVSRSKRHAIRKYMRPPIRERAKPKPDYRSARRPATPQRGKAAVGRVG